jgi:hypothetical protein
MAHLQPALQQTTPMRLSATQTQTILLCVRQQFGADANVMLFGSRESQAPPALRQRSLATMALERALNLPVDILTKQHGTAGGAFARMARGRALALEEPS